MKNDYFLNYNYTENKYKNKKICFKDDNKEF